MTDYRLRNSRRNQSFFGSMSLTNIIIYINVAVFIIVSLLIGFGIGGNVEGGDAGIFRYVALNPELFLGGFIWTLITSMFMHGGLFHLFVNMFSLFFLGDLVERIIGRKRFLWFYLVTGIAAGLFFVAFAYIGNFVPNGQLLFGDMNDFAVGASGAIFGLLGIMAILLPKREVYLIVGPIIVIVLQFFLNGLMPSFSGTINFIATILVFLMLFSLFSTNKIIKAISMPLRLPFWLAPIIAIVPLVIISFFVKLPIGNTAHFGGLIVGVAYGFYLRNKYSRKVKMLNRMFA